MSTAPLSIDVDKAAASFLVDIEPARVWILHEIHQRQHSLMSRWGGPGCWIGMNADESDTVTVPIRVPPGVTEMDLTLMVSGVGDVTITSTNDNTIGSRLVWLMEGDALTQSHSISTAGEIDSSNGANTGRAVTVSGSVSWTWQTERLTFTITAGGPGTIRGVMLRPIHKAR
jgi:hypothetical protein